MSFELAATATGTAEMDITIIDNGGTDDGGENSYTTTLFIHASDLVLPMALNEATPFTHLN